MFYDSFIPKENYNDLEEHYSFEARNILRDTQLRLNSKAQSIYDNSYGENIIVFSLTYDQNKSFQLYSDLLKGKGGILVPKLKNFYYPYKGMFKLPGKSIIDNYNNTVKSVSEEASKYGINRIVIKESLLTNFSTMYDFSKELNTLKTHTVDKTSNSMNPQRREYILNYIKGAIKTFPSNEKMKYSNKVVIIDGPFFEGTKIRLNIQNTHMINLFNPGLLVIEWIYNDIEGFKKFILDNKVSFIFRSAKDGRTLALTPNKKVLDTRLFNPIFIMKALHILDGTKDPEILEMTQEEKTVLEENQTKPVGLDSEDVTVLGKSKEQVDKMINDENVSLSDDQIDKLVEEDFKNNQIMEDTADDLTDRLNDVDFENPEITELTPNDKNDNIDVVSNDLIESEINTTENVGLDFILKRNEKVGSFEDILNDNALSETEKVDKILEVHNFSNIKKDIETKEVKKLKSKLQSKYGRKVEDVVDDIKKHQIKVSNFKNMEQTSYAKSNFINIESTYNEVVGKSDYENILTSPMNSSNSPHFLVSYTEKPESNREFFGKTINMVYEDANGNKQEVTLDYPVSINGKLFIGGSLKQLNLQDAAKPVIKTDQDVIVTTSYNKMFLGLRGTYGSKESKRLILTIDEFVKNGGLGFITKTTTDLGDFIYKNRVSYDLIHLNHYYNKFLLENCSIDFRGQDVEKNDVKLDIVYSNESHNISVKDYTILGHIYGKKVYHNPIENVYITPSYSKVDGKYQETYVKCNTLNEFIMRLIDYSIKGLKNKEEMEKQYKLFQILFSKTSTRRVTTSKINSVYARVMSRDIPVIFLMLIATSLQEVLDRLKEENNLEYKIVKGSRELVDEMCRKSSQRIDALHFNNDVSLIVKYNNTLNEIILSPLMELDLSNEDVFNITNIIRDYIGSSTTIIYIENFVDFFLNDPTAKRVLSLYNIPTDFVGVMIYACSLFTTHITHYKSDSENFRLLTTSEVVNRCLYDVLSKEFSGNAARVKMGSRSRIVIPRDALVKKLQELPNMSEYSVMSPFRSIMRDRKKSAKGQMGTNNSRAFDTTLRMFHENNIGTETASTPYSGEAGVTKTLPVNPTIDSVSGEYKHISMDEAYDDPSKVLSYIESYVPYLYHDHIIRAMMADNQFDHALPVKNADPMCVSTGADESAAYICPSFSIVAEEDGEIISSNDTFTKVKYKSGKIDIISMNEDERNADKGYFVPNKFKLSDELSVGKKFKKGDLIAYNKNFFKPKSNGRVGLSAGPIATVAIIDSEGTWEDACIPFDSLSEKLTTNITKRVARVLDLNTEIRDFNTDLYSVVNADDVLYKYRVLEDDESMNAFFIMDQDLTMTDVTAHNHGIIKDIRVYYRNSRDVSMSESMKKFIKEVTLKQKQLNNADDLKDVTDEFKRIKYNKLPMELTSRGSMSKINGDLIENGKVLIEYYIESEFKLGSGDKLVVDRALKGEPADVYPDELRPVGLDSGRKGDLLFNTYSLLARITPGMILHGCLISIMRHIAIKNRMILNKKPEPGHRLDYKSSMDMVEGKWKYKD